MIGMNKKEKEKAVAKQIKQAVFLTLLVVATVFATLVVVSIRNNPQEALAQVTTMPVYSVELKGIEKSLDGSVFVFVSQRVDGVEVGGSGIIYGSIDVLRAEIAGLHEKLLNSDVGPLILAARAQAINSDFNNINSLLNKALTVDPNSVQVVRFQ